MEILILTLNVELHDRIINYLAINRQDSNEFLRVIINNALRYDKYNEKRIRILLLEIEYNVLFYKLSQGERTLLKFFLKDIILSLPLIKTKRKVSVMNVKTINNVCVVELS